jgi:hypothetical protein
MQERVVSEASNLLLAAMYKEAGDDTLHSSFLYGRPGCRPNEKRFGTTVFFSKRAMIRACVFIRRNGPAHFKQTSLGKIERLLTNFVADNYWHLGDKGLEQFDGPFADNIPENHKREFCEALRSSELFSPKIVTAIFPLVPVNVTDDFCSSSFFLVAPKGLSSSLDQGARLDGEKFPPTSDALGRHHVPSSWLGIKAPDEVIARKYAAAVLGSLALKCHPRERYQHTNRAMFGGACFVCEQGDITINLRVDANTPALAENLNITAADHSWLQTIADKLFSNEPDNRRAVIALEYFFKAWFLTASKRFPWLCMSLDAMFENSQDTQTLREQIRSLLGSHICDARLRLLIRLRASVIHGGAPNVYESSKYEKYCLKYNQDPVFDLQVLVARCLNTKIFDGQLPENPHPLSRFKDDHRVSHRLPRSLDEETIMGSV